MKKQEESTTDRMSLNVHAVTYNLAGKAPKDCDDSDLKLMLKTDEAKVDFYVVGLQEVIPLDISSAGLMVYGESERYLQWRERLHRVVGRDEYRCLIDKSMFGLYMVVFAHVVHAPHAHHVRTESLGVGLFGVGGNKGAVAVRFGLYHSTLCFINCHLAAHQEEIQMRNSDFKSIYTNLRFNIVDPVSRPAPGVDGAGEADDEPEEPTSPTGTTVLLCCVLRE